MVTKRNVKIIEEETEDNDSSGYWTKGDGKPRRRNKLVLTLFLVLFPSILLVPNYPLGFIGSLMLKLALVFYQYVLVKNILSDYYRYLGEEIEE